MKQAVTAFKCPSGIEAMFKDCKTVGYNLEKSYACDDRLKTLILLIALALSCAILQGRKFKLRRIQKYIVRMIEWKRAQRRHSSFWIGLYGQLWVVGMDFCHATIAELMKIRPYGAPILSEGFEGYVLDFIKLLTLVVTPSEHKLDAKREYSGF